MPSMAKALKMHLIELLDNLIHVPTSDYFYCSRVLKKKMLSTVKARAMLVKLIEDYGLMNFDPIMECPSI